MRTLRLVKTALLAAAAAASLAVASPALASPTTLAGAPSQAPLSTTITAPASTAGPRLAPTAVTDTKLSQATAASRLRAAGVTWSSSGGCTTRSNSTCTSFDQINSATVQGVITLRNASGCAINITGGTEVGHAAGTYSHYNGYKVDIAKSTCLNNYVHNTFTRIANRGDGYAQWRAGSGNIYCDEGSHWDITYYSCGC